MKEWLAEDLKIRRIRKAYDYANLCLTLQEINTWGDLYPNEDDLERLEDQKQLAIFEAKGLKSMYNV